MSVFCIHIRRIWKSLKLKHQFAKIVEYGGNFGHAYPLYKDLLLSNLIYNVIFPKQPLSNFEAEIGDRPKQLEAELKNGVAYKKKNVY